LTSAAQSGGRLLDVGGVRRRIGPGNELGIGSIAGDDVHMEMRHNLTGRRAARVPEVDALASEPLAHHAGETLRGGEDLREVIGVDVTEVLCVTARHHQRMTPPPRVDVHERDGVLILGDDRGGQSTRDNPTEDALRRHSYTVELRA
jgi:hypothetical protein